jgi:hypothetical protein
MSDHCRAVNVKDEVKETLDRVRRFETRFTKFLEANGFEVNVRKPTWGPPGRVDILSMATSVKDMLACVPSDWDIDEQVDVYHQNELALSFYPPPATTVR